MNNLRQIKGKKEKQKMLFLASIFLAIVLTSCMMQSVIADDTMVIDGQREECYMAISGQADYTIYHFNDGTRHFILLEHERNFTSGDEIKLIKGGLEYTITMEEDSESDQIEALILDNKLEFAFTKDLFKDDFELHVNEQVILVFLPEKESSSKNDGFFNLFGIWQIPLFLLNIFITIGSIILGITIYIVYKSYRDNPVLFIYRPIKDALRKQENVLIEKISKQKKLKKLRTAQKDARNRLKNKEIENSEKKRLEERITQIDDDLEDMRKRELKKQELREIFKYRKDLIKRLGRPIDSQYVPTMGMYKILFKKKGKIKTYYFKKNKEALSEFYDWDIIFMRLCPRVVYIRMPTPSYVSIPKLIRVKGKWNSFKFAVAVLLSSLSLSPNFTAWIHSKVKYDFDMRTTKKGESIPKNVEFINMIVQKAATDKIETVINIQYKERTYESGNEKWSDVKTLEHVPLHRYLKMKEDKNVQITSPEKVNPEEDYYKYPVSIDDPIEAEMENDTLAEERSKRQLLKYSLKSQIIDLQDQIEKLEKEVEDKENEVRTAVSTFLKEKKNKKIIINDKKFINNLLAEVAAVAEIGSIDQGKLSSIIINKLDEFFWKDKVPEIKERAKVEAELQFLKEENQDLRNRLSERDNGGASGLLQTARFTPSVNER